VSKRDRRKSVPFQIYFRFNRRPMIYCLALTRFIHLAASTLLAAVFAFRLIVLAPAMASARGGICPSRYRGEFDRLAFASWMIVIGSGFAWFGLVAISIDGETSLFALSPQTVWLILYHTHFGQFWLFRFGGCLVLGVLFFRGSRDSTKASLAMVVLASLAGVSHAVASASNAGLLALVGDLGHLITAALWPGGLVPLAVFLRAERRVTGGGNWSLVAHVTQRFSALSLVAVAFLAVTGILNAYFVVGSFRGLWATNYGRLLLVKIGLFLSMIGFGAWNLVVLKPEIIRLGLVNQQEGPPTTITLLIRSLICETFLAACVLLVVGFLGVTPPPMR
jgi:putative copper resistance protein D